MKRTRTGIFTRQKGRAHLHAFGSKRKGSDDSTRIADTSGGHYRCRNSVYDLRSQRECSGKRILGGQQKRAAMAARFKARGDNDVDSSLIENPRFGCGCRGSHRNDSLAAAFVQNLPRRHSDDEAEDRDLCINQDAYLVFNPDRNIRLVVRQRCAQSVYMSSHVLKASRELFPAGSACTLIFRRDPQIHRERLDSKFTNLGDDVSDCRRAQAMRPKGAQSAKIRHLRCQSLCRQTTQRTLNDRVLNSQDRRNTSLVPRCGRTHGLFLHRYPPKMIVRVLPLLLPAANRLRRSHRVLSARRAEGSQRRLSPEPMSSRSQRHLETNPKQRPRLWAGRRSPRQLL